MIGSHPEISSIKLVLGDCEALSVQLPCAERLRTLLQTASKWTTAVESALVSTQDTFAFVCATLTVVAYQEQYLEMRLQQALK